MPGCGSIPPTSARLGERREGPGNGAPRPGGLFSEWFEFFPGILGCSVFVHIHPPGRNGRNVLRVNPIWPIPFHCLRHTTVSTTSQNTQDLHIPPEFRKWATLCMPGCPPRHDPRVRCRKAFVTYYLTYLLWKWVGAPRRHVRGRKGSACATSGGSVWIWKSTPPFFDEVPT